MAILNIFVSFEFDRDKELQNNFYEQAKKETEHRVRDCSLHETYQVETWKAKAKNAIRRCDVMIVLIGQDTHNAPGVRVETDMARSFGKPIIQIRPKKRTHDGLTSLPEPIPWRWKRINAKLDRIANGAG